MEDRNARLTQKRERYRKMKEKLLKVNQRMSPPERDKKKEFLKETDKDLLDFSFDSLIAVSEEVIDVEESNGDDDMKYLQNCSDDDKCLEKLKKSSRQCISQKRKKAEKVVSIKDELSKKRQKKKEFLEETEKDSLYVSFDSLIAVSKEVIDVEECSSNDDIEYIQDSSADDFDTLFNDEYDGFFKVTKQIPVAMQDYVEENCPKHYL